MTQPHPHVIPVEPDLEEPTYQRKGRVITQNVEWERTSTMGKPHEVKPTISTTIWSDDPPTEPGWYYNRPKAIWPARQSDYTHIALYVFLHVSGVLHALDPGGLHSRPVATMPDQWWGPLPDPQA